MLCACRGSWFWLKVVILALAGALALASLSAGEGQPPLSTERVDPDGGLAATESNAVLVHCDLSLGAVLLALGTEMDIMEHRGLAEGLKSPDATPDDPVVREELLALRDALKAEADRHMRSETKRIINEVTRDRLFKALATAARTEGPAMFVFDEFRVEVGFATYSYWRVVLPSAGAKLPLREKGERTIVLPNTKQAYVKLTLRGAEV